MEHIRESHVQNWYLIDFLQKYFNLLELVKHFILVNKAGNGTTPSNKSSFKLRRISNSRGHRLWHQ